MASELETDVVLDFTGAKPEPLYIPSHRHTTSSRRPGVDIAGTVRVRFAALSVCDGCKALRYGSGPHSPHWITRDGRHVQVDCAGREVSHA